MSLPSLSKQHCIAHRSVSPLYQHTTLFRQPQFLPSLSTQHCIAHRSVSPLYQHTTLYRPPQFLPFLSKQLYRPPFNLSPLTPQNHRPPHNFSPLSAHNNNVHRSVSLLSPHNTVSPTAQFHSSLATQHYRPPLSLSPLSAHNTIAHRSVSPLCQHTTLSPTAVTPLSQHTILYRPPLSLFPLTTQHLPTVPSLPSLSTQHYRPPLSLSPLSAHNTVYLHSAETYFFTLETPIKSHQPSAAIIWNSPILHFSRVRVQHTAVRDCASLCLLLRPYIFSQAWSTFAIFLYTRKFIAIRALGLWIPLHEVLLSQRVVEHVPEVTRKQWEIQQENGTKSENKKEQERRSKQKQIIHQLKSERNKMEHSNKGNGREIKRIETKRNGDGKCRRLNGTKQEWNRRRTEEIASVTEKK